MQEHLKRQDGVAKVDVNLESGRVTIHPRPDATIDPAAILKATYDSGVSVAEMTVTARGELVRESSGGWRFKVNARQSFDVVPQTVPESLKGTVTAGGPVTLRGRLFKKPPGRAKKSKAPPPLRLEVLEVLNL